MAQEAAYLEGSHSLSSRALLLFTSPLLPPDAGKRKYFLAWKKPSTSCMLLKNILSIDTNPLSFKSSAKTNPES